MKRVLVIDDDPQIVDMLRSFLSARDLDVVGFDRALDALRELPNMKVDAVISDILMPGMDGLEFLRAVRNLAPEIPVLLITAFPKVEFMRKALEFGAVDFLSKPLNLVDLDLAVKKALEKREAVAAPKLTWREKRLSRKIHRRMREKEIRDYGLLRKMGWRLWDVTQDFRKHPVFYVAAVLGAGFIMWVAAEVAVDVSETVRRDRNSFINLMERAVNALEEDNRIDQGR